MAKPSKLRTNDWGYLVFTLLIVVILICSQIFFGKTVFYTVLCVMPLLAAIAHFVSLLKTKNWGYLIPMLFYVFIILVFFPPITSLTSSQLTRIIFASCAGILFIGEIFVLSSKRINWRYREILELAANPVDESADGFTPRPFPAGKAQYTKEEIIGFTKFMIKHVIAYPFVEESRVILVVPENMFAYMLLLKRGYKKDTYVAFDFNGNISVHIAKKDYQKYKEEFTFDQLCSSLANLFIEFLELYQKGKSREVIDKLNAI
ncbi:MAG: hypothetical protein JSV96_17250 [Candidatus Aminicenantes bacterium]|nr:MAG: hypothetical protein JSV96_17250 [Candidatus Aminicenantes bacterium]